MNLTLERLKLIEELNTIEDINPIYAVKEMLNYAYNVIGSPYPFSDSELISSIEILEEAKSKERTVSCDKFGKVQALKRESSFMQSG